MNKKAILIALFLLFPVTGHALNLSDLPEKIEVAGKVQKVPTASLFPVRPALIVVASHATVSLLERLPFQWVKRGWKLDPARFLGVSSVSKAPWFVKMFLAREGLAGAKKTRDVKGQNDLPNLHKSQIAIDMEGDISKALGADNIGKGGYLALVILESGEIKEIARGVVAYKEKTDKAMEDAGGEILGAAESLLATP